MKDDQELNKSNDKPPIVAFFVTLKPTGKVLTLVGLVLLILSAFAVLAYLCWIVWLPDLWGWGFAKHDWKVLRAAAAVLGAMYLIIIPLSAQPGLSILSQMRMKVGGNIHYVNCVILMKGEYIKTCGIPFNMPAGWIYRLEIRGNYLLTQMLIWSRSLL